MSSTRSGASKTRGSSNKVSSAPMEKQIEIMKQSEKEIEKYLEKTGETKTNYMQNVQNIEDGITTLFRGLWLQYRQGQKTNDVRLVAQSKSTLQNQLTEVVELITQIFHSFSVLFDSIFKETLETPIQNTLFNPTLQFLTNAISNYFAALDDIKKQARVTNNDALLNGLQTKELPIIEKFIQEILELQKSFFLRGFDVNESIDNLNSVQLTDENDDFQDSSDSDSAKRIQREKERFNEMQEKQELFAEQNEALSSLSEFFKNQYNAFSQRILDLYSFKVQQASQEASSQANPSGFISAPVSNEINTGEQQENETEEMLQNNITISEIQRILGYINNQFDELTKKLEDLDNDGEIMQNNDNVFRFINKEYKQLGDIYYKLAYQLWKKAGREQLPQEVQIYGDAIVKFAQKDMDTYNETCYFKLADYADMYYTAAHLNDYQASYSIQEILLETLQWSEDELGRNVQDEISRVRIGVKDSDISDFASQSSGMSSMTASTKASGKSSAKASPSKKKLSTKRDKDIIIEKYDKEMTDLNQKIKQLAYEILNVIYKAQQVSDYIQVQEDKLDDKSSVSNDENDEEEEKIAIFSDLLNNVLQTLYQHNLSLEQIIIDLKSKRPSRNGAVVTAKQSSQMLKSMKKKQRPGDEASVMGSPSHYGDDRISVASKAKSKIGAMSVASSMSFSSSAAFSQKIDEELHIARFAQLTTEELLIFAMRNRLFNDVRKNIYSGKMGQKNLKEFINNINDLTKKYLEHLYAGKEEASLNLEFEHMQQIDEKIKSIQESPTQLAEAFSENFRISVDEILHKYFAGQAHINEKWAIQSDAADEKVEIMFTEKEELHLPQLTLLEKKYFIKTEKEKQRSVPEAESLLDEAKRLASAGLYAEAKQMKQKAFDLEEEILEKRVQQLNKDKKKEKNELIKQQQQELQQLEQISERTHQRINKKYQRKLENLENKLLPSLKMAEKYAVEMAMECISSISGAKDAALSKYKTDKTRQVSSESNVNLVAMKDNIMKLYHNITTEVLTENNMKIQNNVIVQMK